MFEGIHLKIAKSTADGIFIHIASMFDYYSHMRISSEQTDQHMQRKAPRPGPMAVNRVLNLLQTLASPDAPYSLGRLSALLNTPKPSALALLNELVSLGYVRRVDSGFELGSRAFRLGLQMMSMGSVSRLVRDSLRQVSDELKMTVAFGFLDRLGRTLVYGDRYDASGPVRYVVQLGTPLAIHSRALGRLLLAYEPEADWPLWLGEEPYQAFTPCTTTGLGPLSEELRKIRRDGLARTASQQYVGIGSCALPIFDQNGLVSCGIATQTSVHALEAHEPKVIAALRAAAALLGKEFTARDITRDTLPAHM